jgi:phosphatidylethanolamine/phosphatidyl-N-methylethanolamine N-methyltransferase
VNDSFVRTLRQRFDGEPAFQHVADRARILHCLVQDVPDEPKYDLIISGLPLNNFAAEDVRQILNKLMSLLKPGGTLSFFEYIAVRTARALISGRQERARLRGIGQTMGRMLGAHEIRRDWIWPNVPPAWVHHLRA